MTGGFYAKPEINKATARTLTATMVKMHRAGQDNYFSDEYIDSTLKEAKQYENFVVEKLNIINITLEKLHPWRDCFYRDLIIIYKSAKESQVITIY